MVCCNTSSSRNYLNSRDKNSPALSVCSEPTTFTGEACPRLRWALRAATHERTLERASLLVLRKYTNLYRE